MESNPCKRNRQVGCQSDGPSGQDMYNAVRPLHGSRRDNDAEAMAQDDPWASSWRRKGQSIGKSPRSTFLPHGGSDERHREEKPAQFAEGLSAALHVKPLAAPDEEKVLRTMPNTPRSMNPYRRKRAASMVNTPTAAGQGALPYYVVVRVCSFSPGMPDEAKRRFLTSSLLSNESW